jgi:zinc resistance-associated protein
MQHRTLGKVMIVLAIVAGLAIAGTALAGWSRAYGSGYGSGWCPGPGYGWGARGFAPGYSQDLSDEERAQLDEERENFWKETGQLRDQLYQKQLELQSELANQNPDAGKASALQKEISDLQAQMDQKWIDYRVKMGKAAPNYGYMGRGYGPRGFVMGPGYGAQGPMMGPGYGAQGPMMGPGYGYGPRGPMMGGGYSW